MSSSEKATQSTEEKPASYYAEPPEILKRRGDWCLVKCRGSDRTYYYHRRSEVCVWMMPTEWYEAEQAERRQREDEERLNRPLEEEVVDAGYDGDEEERDQNRVSSTDTPPSEVASAQEEANEDLPANPN